ISPWRAGGDRRAQMLSGEAAMTRSTLTVLFFARLAIIHGKRRADPLLLERSLLRFALGPARGSSFTIGPTLAAGCTAFGRTLAAGRAAAIGRLAAIGSAFTTWPAGAAGRFGGGGHANLQCDGVSGVGVPGHRGELTVGAVAEDHVRIERDGRKVLHGLLVSLGGVHLVADVLREGDLRGGDRIRGVGD